MLCWLLVSLCGWSRFVRSLPRWLGRIGRSVGRSFVRSHRSVLHRKVIGFGLCRHGASCHSSTRHRVQLMTSLTSLPQLHQSLKHCNHAIPSHAVPTTQPSLNHRNHTQKPRSDRQALSPKHKQKQNTILLDLQPHLKHDPSAAVSPF